MSSNRLFTNTQFPFLNVSTGNHGSCTQSVISLVILCSSNEVSPDVRESGIQHFLPLESGIQGFGIRNPVPGIRNPIRGIRNPTSSITLESRCRMYCTVSGNFITNHHLPLPSVSPTLITITKKCLVT